MSIVTSKSVKVRDTETTVRANDAIESNDEIETVCRFCEANENVRPFAIAIGDHCEEFSLQLSR